MQAPSPCATNPMSVCIVPEKREERPRGRFEVAREEPRWRTSLPLGSRSRQPRLASLSRRRPSVRSKLRNRHRGRSVRELHTGAYATSAYAVGHCKKRRQTNWKCSEICAHVWGFEWHVRPHGLTMTPWSPRIAAFPEGKS